MSYIKWDVKEVKVEGKTSGDVGEITAILKGSAPWGIDTDVVGLHRDLYNQLNPTLGDGYLYANRPLTEREMYYIRRDMEATRRMVNNNIVIKPDIKQVVFNSPATIVFWKDGSKTVVKAQNDETFDPEKGLAMAIAKKTMGNKGNYYNEIKKWVGEYCKSKPFGDLLMEAANKESSDHTKYAGLRVAYHNLHVVSHDKRSRKSDMIEVMEEAMEYIKKFLDEED